MFWFELEEILFIFSLKQQVNVNYIVGALCCFAEQEKKAFTLSDTDVEYTNTCLYF